MKRAALQGDSFTHTAAQEGFVVGLLGGLALGALTAAAILSAAPSGGASLLVLGTVIGSASLGAGVGIGAGSLMTVPAGSVATGSMDVFACGRPMARALVDITTPCAIDNMAGPIAMGSETVLVNGMPAAIDGAMTACGGVVVGSAGTVVLGGPTVIVTGISEEIPGWLKDTIGAMGLLSIVLTGAGSLLAGVGWTGGFFFGLIVGDKLGSLGRSIGQELGGEAGAFWGEVILGFVGSVLGGTLGSQFGARWLEEVLGLRTGAARGSDPSEYNDRVGLTRFRDHPERDAVIREANAMGFEVRESTGSNVNEASTRVTVLRQRVNGQWQTVGVERTIEVNPDSRMLDIRHEIGHAHQFDRMRHSGGERATRAIEPQHPTRTVQNPRLLEGSGVLTASQIQALEFHNRLVEVLELDQRGASNELLREHVEGVIDNSRLLSNTGRIRENYFDSGSEGGRWIRQEFHETDGLIQAFREMRERRGL